jgi:hypothetical protein
VGALKELAVAHPMMGMAVLVVALMVVCFAARTAWESHETDSGGALTSAALAIGIAVWLGVALFSTPRISAANDSPACAALRC